MIGMRMTFSPYAFISNESYTEIMFKRGCIISSIKLAHYRIPASEISIPLKGNHEGFSGCCDKQSAGHILSQQTKSEYRPFLLMGFVLSTCPGGITDNNSFA